MAARENDYQPGDIIRGNGAEYEVLAVLGAGGMGAVYLVRDKNIGRRFVLKVLHKRLAHRRDIMARFEAEARALGHLVHPGIIEIFQLNRTTDEQSVPYYLMEVLEGESLADSLRRHKKLDLFVALGIATKLLHALDHAHERGVVHRDIKPDNIYLHRGASSEPVVKLLDFGILKLVAQEDDPGFFIGTPRYCAPEQLKGGSSIGPKADLYAVGVVLFLMLTGHQPFEGYGGSLEEMVMTLAVEAPPLTKHGEYPAALVAVVASALAKDPAGRPTDAFAFASALRTIRREFAPDREDPHTHITAEVLTEGRAAQRDPSQITVAHLAAPTAPDADMGKLMEALRESGETPATPSPIERQISISITPVSIGEKAGLEHDTTEQLAERAKSGVKRDAVTVPPKSGSDVRGPGSVEYLTRERAGVAAESAAPVVTMPSVPRTTAPLKRPVVYHSTEPMAGRPGRFAQPVATDARTPEPHAIDRTPKPATAVVGADSVRGVARRLQPISAMKLLPIALALGAAIFISGLVMMRARSRESIVAPAAASPEAPSVVSKTEASSAAAAVEAVPAATPSPTTSASLVPTVSAMQEKRSVRPAPPRASTAPTKLPPAPSYETPNRSLD